jgi:hypothetical protein
MAKSLCVMGVGPKFMPDAPKFVLGDGSKFMCVIRGKWPNIHACYSWEMTLHIDGDASFDNPQGWKRIRGTLEEVN